jgi:phosphoglycolate phosphatase
MSKPQAILFDLDGTLIDSSADLCHTVGILLQQEGLPPLSVKAMESLLGHGLKQMLLDTFHVSGRDLDDKELQRLRAAFDKIYVSVIPKPSCLYNGVVAFLEQLNAQGVKCGLCTNKGEVHTKRLLDQLNLTGHFQAIIGGDTTPKLKPDPLPLLTALEILKVVPENAVMIGDHMNDVNAARAAGLKSIAVRYGYTREWPSQPQPDAFINSMGECTGILSSLFLEKMAARTG